MTGRAKPTAALPQPQPGAAPFPTVPQPERFTLDNGLRVVAVHRAGLPQLAARLVVNVGAVSDPPDQPGAAALVSALITEGTENLDALGLHQRIDALGASLCARAGHDFTEIDVGLLSETMEEGIRLLADVVTRPSFPDREVERVRSESLDALEARLDEPANIADDHASEAIFGTDHPYGRLPLGTIEGVRALRRSTLVDFHRAFFRPAGSFLVLAGDLGGNGLRGLLERAFEGWEGISSPVNYPSEPSEPLAAGELESVEWADAAQGEIRVAGLGMRRSSADWIPGAVANFVLGGSTITGRLGTNLREDKGWTYGVRSGFAAGVQPGGWVVETAVEAQAVEAALSEIDREVERMVREAVEAEELDRAKEALILSLPRAFETPGRIVARLATVEAFGLDPDYWQTFGSKVRAVDAEAVQRIASRYFAPATLVRVAVGPAIEGAARRTG